MKTLSLLLISSLALSLGGCASTSVTHAPAAAATGSIEKIRQGSSIMVSTPTDGQFGTKMYSGTGVSVAQNFEAAFEPYMSDVIRVGAIAGIEEGLTLAASKGCKYLAIPKITHWEDRATEWSGKADRVAVRLRVIEVSTKAEILNVEIKGKSSWLTLGGDHPEQLLAKPINEFVATLF